MQYEISAVVPVYNAIVYLSQTIESLQNQTYQLKEIIIVDDCSTDDTLQLARSLAIKNSKIKIIQQSTNQGGSAARNIGLQQSKNDWVLFMDADDIIHPQLLEKQVAKLLDYQKSQPTIPLALVHPAYKQIDGHGNEIAGSEMRGKQVEYEETFGTLLFRNHVITPSGLLVNKRTAMEVGGFQSFRIIEDYDFVLRMSQAGYFAYVDEPLVYFRRHGANLTKDITKAAAAERAVVEQYGIEKIREAIFKRKLPESQNYIDYVNMLFRYEYWDDGYQYLQQLNLENHQSVLFLNAIFHLHYQDFTLAKEYFLKILALNTEHGASLNNLGVILALDGEFEEAEKVLETAIKRYPGYMDADRNINLVKERILSDRTMDGYHFTWRELRPNLLRYS